MAMFDNSNVEYYSKMLDVLAKRHKVISNNIANVNTPGYRSKDIAFKNVLQNVMDLRETTVNDQELSAGILDIETEEVYDNNGLDKSVGNDVDIDKEMMKMSTNALLYKAYAQLMIMRLRQISLAIREKG